MRPLTMMTESVFVVSPKESTPQEEYDRMAENLWANMNSVIKDKESFEEAYDDYFQTDVNGKLDSDTVRQKLWVTMLDRYGSRIDVKEDELLKEGGGKGINQGKARLARRVTVSPIEYVRLGASKVDLAGYDTPPGYVFLGVQRSKRGITKTVYARVIRTKTNQLRFIDRRGRYVSYKYKQGGGK